MSTPLSGINKKPNSLLGLSQAVGFGGLHHYGVACAKKLIPINGKEQKEQIFLFFPIWSPFFLKSCLSKYKPYFIILNCIIPCQAIGNSIKKVVPLPFPSDSAQIFPL